MSVSYLPAPARARYPVATRRSWTVGYTVETLELAAEQEHGWARDAAWGAARLDAPRTGGGGDFERALSVAPPIELQRAPIGAESWHQAGMPLPTSSFLAMRDATRHLR